METMKKEKIIKLLDTEYSKHPTEVEQFAAYCVRIKNEKEKDSPNPKNPWMQKKTEMAMAELFKRVLSGGLFFDGVHVTLQSTGVSYDYVAYKNRMLRAYPESEIDIQLVYEGDDFSFVKDSGMVNYTHTLSDPFNQVESKIKGGYCVIKNKRGQFLTILTKPDFEKHKLIAKTQKIWNQWYKEMCMKTLIKKACKTHFDDLYQVIEQMDNENYSLEKLDLQSRVKADPMKEREKMLIDDCETLEELEKLIPQLTLASDDDISLVIQTKLSDLTPPAS